MTELAPSSDPEAKKRRSTRLVQAVPLIVAGVDALGRPFRERTSTFIINCHGCRYESKHHVLKNTWVTLTIPRREADREPRVVRARVTWVQQPHDLREPFRIGVELETPGNIWEILFPPDDWFPFPESTVFESASLAVSEPAAAQTLPDPAAESPKDNLRTMPLGGLAEASPALEREVKRLLEAAAEQFQASGQEQWNLRLSESVGRAGRELTARLEQLEQEGRARFERHLETRIQHSVEDLRRATEGSSASLVELAESLQRDLSSRCEHAGDVLRQVETSAQQAERVLRGTEENLQKLSQQAVQAALDRLEGTVGTRERQFEATIRSTAAKSVEEIDSRAAHTIHTAFESLLKTAGGYEQNIQTQIQTTLEMGLEQARASLREKAGEVQGLLAAEVRRHSRSTAENAPGELEEFARALPERVCPPSREWACTTTVEQPHQNPYEAALAEMKTQAAQARSRMQPEIERLSAEFRAALVQVVQQIQGSAGQELASEMEASRANLHAMLRTQRDQAREALDRLANQTIDEYMPRLENTSNAWLVATLAKLARQSEVQIENLARLTAERLNQTCDEVLASLGRTLWRLPDSAPPDTTTSPSAEQTSGEAPSA